MSLIGIRRAGFHGRKTPAIPTLVTRGWVRGLPTRFLVFSRSWSDAAQQAVAWASKTLRHITGLDVQKSSAVVKDGKITEYHVNVKLAFVVEGAEIEA